MKAYFAFTKKEFTESLRTYKLWIMLAVFFLFGMMSPLFAKLTPEILKSVDLGGMQFTMPEPTAMDAWKEFFNNIGQMGLLVLVILFAGLMASEFSRGTLINMLTKGLTRHTVIFSKLTAAILLWTASYLLALATSYGYTVYFWDMGSLHHAFFAFFAPWLFGSFLIVLLVLGGVLFQTFSGSLLFTGGVVVILTVLNIVPKLQKYNPMTLCGDHTTLLTGVKNVSDILPAFIVCALLIVVLTVGAVVVFNRKQI
ncbi:ABC transporter permease [Clostridia bacterium]|nr:ABC transporter permease [Clostridia bacterium]